MSNKLYLAYGANTHMDHMARRCPTAQYICNITLNHHRLVFRGVADVEQERGARVRVAMWLIGPQDEAALDRFEGFPHHYVKRYINIYLESRRHRAMFYVIRKPEPRGQQLPPRSYEQTLREGYDHCGISQRQIDTAIKRATSWQGEVLRPYRGKWVDEAVSEAPRIVVPDSASLVDEEDLFC